MNLVDAVSMLQLDKYCEINSIFVNAMTDILKQPNTNFYMFGFIEQNNNSMLESSITLDIMNKFKRMNVEYFFDVISEMNIDHSKLDIKYTKDEFHIIDTIVYILI
jgi:phage terminase small subunit